MITHDSHCCLTVDNRLARAHTLPYPNPAAALLLLLLLLLIKATPPPLTPPCRGHCNNSAEPPPHPHPPSWHTLHPSFPALSFLAPLHSFLIHILHAGYFCPSFPTPSPPAPLHVQLPLSRCLHEHACLTHHLHVVPLNTAFLLLSSRLLVAFSLPSCAGHLPCL